jgi:hypothetical protein
MTTCLHRHLKRCLLAERVASGTEFRQLVANPCVSYTAWITFETVWASLGSNRVERQSLMFPGRDSHRPQTSNKNTVRYYSAWVQCGLLLLFCVSSRTARYGIQNRNLKLATTQSFLVNDEARLEAVIAALLLLGCVAILPVPRFIANAAANVVAPDFVAFASSEYDCHSYPRPPPHA